LATGAERADLAKPDGAQRDHRHVERLHPGAAFLIVFLA
jgi:hypothetical protein